MPELPDVELMRRYLDATSLGQTIEEARVLDEGVLAGVSADEVESRLRGRRLRSSLRRGKHLFAALDRDGWLGLHFGMDGSLAYLERPGELPPYTRFAVRFAGGARLAYITRRKLGRVRLIEDVERFMGESGLGPDALTLDREGFVHALRGTRSPVKAALMDQRRIAGLGNIYADEVLFQAGVHPKTRSDTLDDGQLGRLYKAVGQVLDAAIECGADPQRLPADTYMLPHRRGDGVCPRCGGRMVHERIAGRTAYYCPRCQGGDAQDDGER